MSTKLDGFPNIPLEIIIEIFLSCLPDLKPYRRPDPREAPILLTHVCPSWRKLASHVPELWASISLSESDLSDSELGNGNLSLSVDEIVALKRRLLDQHALWKSNSGNHPLDVFIRLISKTDVNEQGGGEEDTSPKSVHPIGNWDTLLTRAIVENAQRLRRLHVKLNSLEHGAPIYTLPSASMPNLESLQLFIYLYSTTTLMTAITSFRQASNLRRVTLKLPPPFLTKVDLPWAKLTHLALLSAAPRSFFHVIAEKCPELQTLSLNLDIETRFEQTYHPTDNATMMNLKQLSLSLSGVADLGFLSPITFPCLHQMSFSGRPVTWIQPFPHDRLHFINQLHLLRSLTLTYQNIPCNALLKILRQTPLLVELVIDSEVGEYSEFLENLTYDSEAVGHGKSLLIPELEIFRLYVEITEINRPPSFTTDSFFNMITSRSNLVIHSEIGPDKGSHRPTQMKTVFLCIERVEDSRQQMIDLEDLASRVEHFIELDSGILLTFDISSQSEKNYWLEEDIVSWATW